MRLADLSDHRAERAAQQWRIASRRQLLAAGVSPDALAWRVRSGRWQRLLPGIYALFAGRLTEEERFVTATLHGGRGAQITGAAALRWYGFRYVADTDPSRILLNVLPGGRRRASTGFVQVVRTARPDRMSRLRDGFEVCSVARSAADAARRVTAVSDVRALVAEVVQRKRASIAELTEELDAGPVQGSAALRRVLVEVRDGARSRPEAELRELLARSEVLPVVLWNPVLVDASGCRLPTPDGWIEDGAIALEADSQEFHFELSGWERTMARRNAFEANGIAVLSFSPARIRRESGAVLHLIEKTYLARKGIKVNISARPAR